MYLFGYGGSQDTIAKLANILDCKYGTCPPNSDDLVINWGTEDVPKKHRNVLNRKVYLNKLEAHKVLARKVRVPKLWENFEDIPINEFPVLGRYREHSQGVDIALINTKEDYVKRDYYVKCVDIIAEVRAHVLGDKVFLSQKTPKHRNGHSKLIWNLRNGYTYYDIDGRTFGWFTKWLVKRKARKAVRALGYDFGAVDIVIDGGDWFDRVWVLEVNSAPGLIPKRAKWYADYFISLNKSLVKRHG